MTLIYFILVLGITIFIHELGHFIFAKKAGVYVYEFSLGMGPIIFKKKRKNDDTNYCIRLFPIGGFVAMAGEDTQDEKVKPELQLINKPWKDRFLTIIAGVLFNFLLAIVLLFIVGLLTGVPKNDTTISKIETGYPLEATNMQVGDKIIKINDKNVSSSDKMTLLLSLNKGEETTFTVKHENGEIENITVTPAKVEIEEETTYRFGLEISGERTHNLIDLLLYPFKKTFSLVEQMALIIKYLILGKLSINNLSGPIGIYTIVGETSKAGLASMLYLIAYLCINVGFINFIPLPAFDGGRAFFLIIEKIRGKKINSNIENIIHTIGFYLLMLLMILITYNDILRFIR
jgi:regulator of sigma E protease